MFAITLTILAFITIALCYNERNKKNLEGHQQCLCLAIIRQIYILWQRIFIEYVPKYI